MSIPKSLEKFIKKCEKQEKKFKKFEVGSIDQKINTPFDRMKIGKFESLEKAYEIAGFAANYFGPLSVSSYDQNDNIEFLLPEELNLGVINSTKRYADAKHLPVDLILAMHPYHTGKWESGDIHFSFSDEQYEWSDHRPYYMNKGVLIKRVYFSDSMNEWYVECEAGYSAIFQVPDGYKDPPFELMESDSYHDLYEIGPDTYEAKGAHIFNIALQSVDYVAYTIHEKTMQILDEEEKKLSNWIEIFENLEENEEDGEED